MSTPVVVPDQIVVGKPVVFDVVNIYNSFDPRIISNSQHNLVPILVLGLHEPVPSGTAPGTAIIRITN
jgi:hypothetical protein